MAAVVIESLITGNSPSKENFEFHPFVRQYLGLTSKEGKISDLSRFKLSTTQINLNKIIRMVMFSFPLSMFGSVILSRVALQLPGCRPRNVLLQNEPNVE